MRRNCACSRFVGCVLALFIAGCEGGPTGVLNSLRPTPDAAQSEKLEQQHRQKYLADRDAEALQWLLVNRVRQGMSVGEVGEVLGQDGEREFDDRKLKAGNPLFRADDKAYRWGPDSEGRAIYFLFRDGKLLNFDPKEFAEQRGE